MPFDGTNFPRSDTLGKIDAVTALIADERRWCKGSLINAGGQMCLIGAMRSVRSDAVLKPLVLQAVQEVTGKRFRTIESFNDNHGTTHAVVLQVLERTRQNIVAGRLPGGVPPVPIGARCRSLLQRWTMRFRGAA